MDKKSLKITTGAMCTAIFGMLLLLNRQTGNFFQDIFLFMYPIPMVAYAAMYGWKSGLAVCMAMSLLSFLFGSFTAVFYAVAQALTGLVFGGCLYHKVDMTKTLFAVMLMSAAVNVLNTIVLGFLFGYDLNQEVAEVQTMMNSMLEMSGTAVPETMLSINYLKQMLVVSMTVFGFLQGFIVYEVSLLILRRLRFPVQKPKSVFLYVPPKWTGYCALFLFLNYGIRMVQPLENDALQNAFLLLGIFGYVYLIGFGFIAILLYLKICFPQRKILAVLICILILFWFSAAALAAGFFYIVSRLRQSLAEKYLETRNNR